MAMHALSHLALWHSGTLSLLLLCAHAACPELCECPHPQHVLCANRGLHAVPESNRSVRVLGLAGNSLCNLSEHALAHYDHLTRLDLQFNQIRRIHPKALAHLMEIEELYLGHNLITELQPGTFGTLRKLAVLCGNDNVLRELRAGTFGKLESLVRLRLDKNSIELLSESVFKHFSSLMFLHLESNQLQHIHHETFSSLTKLQFLDLSNNKQTQLHHTALFSQLRSLVTLLLSRNHITHIGAQVFQNLKKLTKLSLSNNNILSLENGTLQGLMRLRELAFDGNELSEIRAGVLDPLTRIEQLNLSDNQITRIDPAAFTHLTCLRVLDLSNNRLRRISGAAFTSNTALFQLDLSGNQWRCDCRMEKLKEWMEETRARGKLLTTLVRCHHPPSLEGKYLDRVNDTELLVERNESRYCLQAGEAGGQETPGVSEERQRRGGVKEEHTVALAGKEGHKKPKKKNNKKLRLRPRPAPRASVKASSSEALLGTLTTKMFPLMENNISMWELNDSLQNPGSQNRVGSVSQTGVERYAARSVEVSDACEFNRQYIVNVSVHNVTFDSSTVLWNTPADTPSVRGRALTFRILFDRFGHSVRFPRYVYTDGSARAVTLQELRPDSTYITCVESVVNGALCQVAPRDHCVGFVTTSPSAERDIKLQHVTAAVLTLNALLILLVGGVWLGRVLRRRLKTRKSSTHTHVRHIYSTRRPFRSAMATTCVSSEFSGYQSGRPLAEEGDLIQFPAERFYDSSCTRRDDGSVIPRLSD